MSHMLRDDDDDRSSRFDPVTIYFDDVTAETEFALLLDVGGDKVWIPKSQTSSVRPVAIGKGCGEGHLDIPQWLADEKGLG